VDDGLDKLGLAELAHHDDVVHCGEHQWASAFLVRLHLAGEDEIVLEPLERAPWVVGKTLHVLVVVLVGGLLALYGVSDRLAVCIEPYARHHAFGVRRIVLVHDRTAVVVTDVGDIDAVPVVYADELEHITGGIGVEAGNTRHRPEGVLAEHVARLCGLCPQVPVFLDEL